MVASKLTLRILGLLAVTAMSSGFLDKTNTQNLCEGIVEENDMFIPESAAFADQGITKEEFNAVIDHAEKVYAPIFAAKGAKLVVNRKWEDGTVNAYAQRFGNEWHVSMFGGLARHATTNVEGFYLVICHEFGHHLGGAPKYSGFGNVWASTEGQSDYFATAKCMRRLFADLDNEGWYNEQQDINATVDSSCDDASEDWDEYYICVRMAAGGQSVANLFAALRREANSKVETPDKTVVNKTFEAHPKTQCRLDTYFQGALCEVGFDTDFSDTDAKTGACNTSTGHQTGVRPLCWYKP